MKGYRTRVNDFVLGPEADFADWRENFCKAGKSLWYGRSGKLEEFDPAVPCVCGSGLSAEY